MFPECSQLEEHSPNRQRTHLTMSMNIPRAYESDDLLQLITNCVQDLKLFCTIGGQSCSGLTVGQCSIFVRNTMLHIRSMSNDLGIVYQS